MSIRWNRQAWCSRCVIFGLIDRADDYLWTYTHFTETPSLSDCLLSKTQRGHTNSRGTEGFEKRLGIGRAHTRRFCESTIFKACQPARPLPSSPTNYRSRSFPVSNSSRSSPSDAPAASCAPSLLQPISIPTENHSLLYTSTSSIVHGFSKVGLGCSRT
ncbi:hypothetical protein HGRIS_006116 [Hohenbuehelia grisea]|uniref:Uncharacterized protein n=1 Tax=Hohenbuehelia grisea TaxID=104357 RepID=A0ABR3JZ01_9AGAR